MPNEEHPADAGPAAAGPPGEPLFQVVAGQPTHEEVAALAAALTARRAASARQAAAARPPASGWADREPLLRRQLTARPGGWRRCARPG
jgi:hypothetical protein